jgi:hypothetical protein
MRVIPIQGSPVGETREYVRRVSIQVRGSVNEKFVKLREESSASTVSCYNSTPMNTDSEFNCHKLKCYNSTPTM